MEDRRRTWLRHWHGVIDRESGGDPSLDFETAYADPSGDFRMHFATWDLSDTSLRRCFEVLPLGRQVADRAIEMRSLHRANAPVSEETALDLFQDGLDAYGEFSDEQELKRRIRVMRVSKGGFRATATNTDRVAVVLEGINWTIVPEHGEAASFIRETLYRLADSYDVADYVAWPLLANGDQRDPFLPFAILGTSDRFFPLLDENGPVLFITTDDLDNTQKP